jgi:hypothetical protein
MARLNGRENFGNEKQKGKVEENKNLKGKEKKLLVHYSGLVQHFAVRGFNLRAFEVILLL